MIAQSLGGMEIVVRMSSLTGGLVLNKSELVQGSELPINYLFASTPMCENYAVAPLFFLYFPIYCKTSCPRHDIKLHNYASQLLRQHVARAYGQDTLYWL